MHLKSIPILPEQLGVPGGDQRLNLRGPADRVGRRGREIWSGFAWLSQDGKSRPLSNGIQPKNGRKMPGSRREGRRGREIWSGFAWLSQDGKSRPLSNGIQPKNGRKMPGSRSLANLDRSGRPNGRKVFSRKTVGKCQAPAAWQISTVLGGPTGGSPPERNPPEGSPTEGNPTEERGRRRRPLQV